MMHYYLIVPLLVALLFASISFHPRIKRFLDHYTIFTNLWISILGAYIGVFAGTYFSNLQSQQTEQNDYRNLLLASATDVEAAMNELDNTFQNLDTFLYQVRDTAWVSFVHHNELPHPSIAAKILSSNELLKHLSVSGIRNIGLKLENIQETRSYIKTSVDDFEALHNTEVYRKILLNLWKIIRLEVAIMDIPSTDPQQLDQVYTFLFRQSWQLPIADYKTLVQADLPTLLQQANTSPAQ